MVLFNKREKKTRITKKSEISRGRVGVIVFNS